MRISGDFWPASLAKLVNSKFKNKTVSKNKVDDSTVTKMNNYKWDFMKLKNVCIAKNIVIWTNTVWEYRIQYEKRYLATTHLLED